MIATDALREEHTRLADEHDLASIIDLEGFVARRTQVLRASEERYRRLFDTMPQGAVYQDASGRILEANPAARRLLGLPDGPLTPESAPDWTPIREDGTAFPAHELPMVLAIRTGCVIEGVVMGLRWGSGNVTWVEVSVTPVLLDGRPCILGLYRDVTGRRREEAERQRLQDELVRAQRMDSIGMLAGGVAHDFNNLLSVILGYVGLIIEAEETPAKIREDLLEVRCAAERSAELTRQLLAFGRKQLMKREPIDLNRVAVGVDKLLRRIIGEDIELSFQLAPELGIVCADPCQLEQVLMNLAANARDAMPDGGRLVFATSNVTIDASCCATAGVPPGDYVRVTVSDTGCGMDEATQARIFEPFFTTKLKGRGTGLGLATVYGIVRQSGGFIRVRSEPGRGATFELHFPRTAEGSTSSKRERTSTIERARGTEVVLVVEDAAAVRGLTERALRDAGYDVLTATDGVDALRVIEAQGKEVALVLTDLVMPRMGGEELARKLTALRPDTRVLFMSGYSSMDLRDDHVVKLDRNFIEKPIEVPRLLRRVREALDEPRV
ncbi:ATP-binding protein [Myxococcota bacterium]|nr:ATP-binding protein [Myxococcota bacterium]